MSDESQYGKGYIPRDFQSHPLGQLACAPRFSLPLIDPKDYRDIIAQKDADNSWMKDVIDRNGIKRKNQRDYPWCHAAGPVGAAELARVMSGMPWVGLSIASVAGPAVNWARQGAWIFTDLEVCETKGIAETSVFPDLTQDSRLYNSPEVQANIAKHRVRAMDLDTNRWDELVTCCLSDIATVIGVPDWSHCTMGPVKARWSNGEVILLMPNNWGDEWNGGRENAVNGFYEVRRGGLHTPGEAYAIFSVGA